MGHLTKGLALVRASIESPERDAQELQFLNPLGTTYIATRGYAAPEVGPVFQRARELLERVGSPPQQFAIMRGAFAWHVVATSGCAQTSRRRRWNLPPDSRIRVS
jgi:hypothetical protein